MTAQLRFKRAEYVAWTLLYLDLLLILPGGGTLSLAPQTLFRITTLSIAAIIIIPILLSRAGTFSQLLKQPLSYAVIYAVVALFSASYATMPQYTLWKSGEFALATLAVAVMLSMRPQWLAAVKLYNLTLLLIALTALSALLGAIIAPSMALVPTPGLIPVRLYGVIPYMNSNTVGSLAAFVALTCFARSVREPGRKLRWILLFFLFLALVVFSTSRTALIGLLLALLVYSIFDRRRWLMFVTGGLTLGASMMAAVQELAVVWFRKEAATSTLETLSGRTIGWEAAWGMFLESPIFGYGLASAGRFDISNETGRFFMTLHGSFFDVLVGVGLLGTIPWLVMIIVVGLRLWRHTGKSKYNPAFETWLQWRSELLGMFVLVVVRSTTSTVLGYHEKEQMLFFCLLAFTMVAMKRPRRASADGPIEMEGSDPGRSDPVGDRNASPAGGSG